LFVTPLEPFAKCRCNVSNGWKADVPLCGGAPGVVPHDCQRLESAESGYSGHVAEQVGSFRPRSPLHVKLGHELGPTHIHFLEDDGVVKSAFAWLNSRLPCGLAQPTFAIVLLVADLWWW
jgi:hypothetical protein